MKILFDWVIICAFIGLMLGVLLAFIFGIIYEDIYSSEGVLALFPVVIYPIPITLIVGIVIVLFKQ